MADKDTGFIRELAFLVLLMAVVAILPYFGVFAGWAISSLFGLGVSAGKLTMLSCGLIIGLVLLWWILHDKK
jgi:hypothetical protein